MWISSFYNIVQFLYTIFSKIVLSLLSSYFNFNISGEELLISDSSKPIQYIPLESFSSSSKKKGVIRQNCDFKNQSYRATPFNFYYSNSANLAFKYGTKSSFKSDLSAKSIVVLTNPIVSPTS